jgi:hypothetical protein
VAACVPHNPPDLGLEAFAECGGPYPQVSPVLRGEDGERPESSPMMVAPPIVQPRDQAVQLEIEYKYWTSILFKVWELYLKAALKPSNKRISSSASRNWKASSSARTNTGEAERGRPQTPVQAQDQGTKRRRGRPASYRQNGGLLGARALLLVGRRRREGLEAEEGKVLAPSESLPVRCRMGGRLSGFVTP